MDPTRESPCCASLPLLSLAALADLRREVGITVTTAGDRVWVCWEAGTEAVVRRVLPLPGAELYSRRDGLWYRLGHHLPAFGLPVEDQEASIPLYRAITPEPAQAVMPDGMPSSSARLRLVRDQRVRGATAARCALAELSRWVESALTAEIAALTAAWSGDEVIVRGARLPAIAGCARFWGERVLVPLGFRPEPSLPEPALRRALHVQEGTLLVLTAQGIEEVPDAAFGPLTRAGVRLARALAEEGRQP
jgi:hypothetical protein